MRETCRAFSETTTVRIRPTTGACRRSWQHAVGRCGSPRPQRPTAPATVPQVARSPQRREARCLEGEALRRHYSTVPHLTGFRKHSDPDRYAGGLATVHARSPAAAQSGGPPIDNVCPRDPAVRQACGLGPIADTARAGDECFTIRRVMDGTGARCQGDSRRSREGCGGRRSCRLGEFTAICQAQPGRASGPFGAPFRRGCRENQRVGEKWRSCRRGGEVHCGRSMTMPVQQR
jgi:hypothetical protein